MDLCQSFCFSSVSRASYGELGEEEQENGVTKKNMINILVYFVIILSIVTNLVFVKSNMKK
jgi:hypothetical protein